MNKKYQNIKYVFSYNLKKIRDAKGLNQTEIAKKVGIKQSTLSHYENGVTYPKTDTINKIIKALDIERSELFLTPSEAEDGDLNQSYNNRLEHKNILEYINTLENNGELRVDISNNLKTYILMLFQEMNDQQESLIKHHEKYEALRDRLGDNS